MTTRRELLRRLHRHPDDFEATRALRALDADPSTLGPRDDSASEHLVRSGLSGVERDLGSWTRRSTGRTR